MDGWGLFLVGLVHFPRRPPPLPGPRRVMPRPNGPTIDVLRVGEAQLTRGLWNLVPYLHLGHLVSSPTIHGTRKQIPHDLSHMYWWVEEMFCGLLNIQRILRCGSASLETILTDLPSEPSIVYNLFYISRIANALAGQGNF